MIQLSELPSYEDTYESDPDINAINQFLMNNKITKLTIGSDVDVGFEDLGLYYVTANNIKFLIYGSELNKTFID